MWNLAGKYCLNSLEYRATYNTYRAD